MAKTKSKATEEEQKDGKPKEPEQPRKRLRGKTKDFSHIKVEFIPNPTAAKGKAKPPGNQDGCDQTNVSGAASSSSRPKRTGNPFRAPPDDDQQHIQKFLVPKKENTNVAETVEDNLGDTVPGTLETGAVGVADTVMDTTEEGEAHQEKSPTAAADMASLGIAPSLEEVAAKFSEQLIKGAEKIALDQFVSLCRSMFQELGDGPDGWHKYMDYIFDELEDEEMRALLDQAMEHRLLHIHEDYVLKVLHADHSWRFADPEGDEFEDLKEFIRWLVAFGEDHDGDDENASGGTPPPLVDADAPGSALLNLAFQYF